MGLAECSSDAECMNIEGSYECYCISGYEGDGFICKGINIASLLHNHYVLFILP